MTHKALVYFNPSYIHECEKDVNTRSNTIVGRHTGAKIIIIAQTKFAENITLKESLTHTMVIDAVRNLPIVN